MFCVLDIPHYSDYFAFQVLTYLILPLPSPVLPPPPRNKRLMHYHCHTRDFRFVAACPYPSTFPHHLWFSRTTANILLLFPVVAEQHLVAFPERLPCITYLFDFVRLTLPHRRAVQRLVAAPAVPRQQRCRAEHCWTRTPSLAQVSNAVRCRLRAFSVALNGSSARVNAVLRSVNTLPRFVCMPGRAALRFNLHENVAPCLRTCLCRNAALPFGSYCAGGLTCARLVTATFHAFNAPPETFPPLNVTAGPYRATACLPRRCCLWRPVPYLLWAERGHSVTVTDGFLYGT